MGRRVASPTPLPFGPRNCNQSAAKAAAESRATAGIRRNIPILYRGARILACTVLIASRAGLAILPRLLPTSHADGSSPERDPVVCCWLRAATSHPIRRRSADRTAVDRESLRGPVRGSEVCRRERA